MLKVIEFARIDRTYLKDFIIGDDYLERFPKQHDRGNIGMVSNADFLHCGHLIRENPLRVDRADQGTLIRDLRLCLSLLALPLLHSCQISLAYSRRGF